MAELDFITAFYRSSHDRGGIVGDIESILGATGKDVLVSAVPFSTTADPSLHLPVIESRRRKVTRLNQWDGLAEFELAFNFKVDGEQVKDAGRFFVLTHSQYKNVYVALTIERGRFVRKGLLPLLRSQFPYFIVGFVPHARLKRMLTTFRAAQGFTDLIITRTTERLRMPEEGEHRRVMPVISWPDMALDEAFDWLAEHNGWFQSVQFSAKREAKTAALISVTREGLVRCDRLFESVYESFVESVCKIHQENFNLFARRSRRDNPDLSVRPLAIIFEEGQFDDVVENHVFLSALRSLKTSSVSVIHGNPYIHAVVTDYLDGSSFDLWVVDSKELVIVPQMYGSVAAIKRLINHVFDAYAEGDVIDYEEME